MADKPKSKAISFSMMAQDKIDAAIVSIGKRAASLQMDVHKAAVSILHHWSVTGDFRPAVVRMNALCDAFGVGGMRANALRDWAMAYGGMEYNEAEKCLVQGKDKAGKGINVKAAMAEPFWLFSPEPAYKPVVFLDLLLSDIRKAEKAAANPKDGDVVDVKLLEAIRATISAHKAEAAGH